EAKIILFGKRRLSRMLRMCDMLQEALIKFMAIAVARGVRFSPPSGRGLGEGLRCEFFYFD
ncbi:MAG TPA: hypothetical protein VFD48_17935, partial [Pyrinomonadaceae bacterium]|nr:hypothetical protein [Pyrinomonadaceae bacterium]